MKLKSETHELSLFLSTLTLFALIQLSAGQGMRPNGRGRGLFNRIQPGDPVFQQRLNANCSSEFRSIDGSCTNPFTSTWASAGIAQFTYFPRRSSATPSGGDLPSARFVSNMLSSQVGNIPNDRRLSEFVVFFGQFLDHCFISTPSGMSEQFPISIPTDDPVFGNFTNGQLRFTRSLRGASPQNPAVQQPINALSSTVELTAVYSSNEQRLQGLRLTGDCKMRTSSGDLLPFNNLNFVNAPTSGPQFFLAGDHRSNEHPVLTAIHTLFLREHNLLCDELKAAFPDWDYERLFQSARHINNAQFQKIVYEEWFPAITGRRMTRYNGFRQNVNPTLSKVFGGAAFRVGHTMVGPTVNRYTSRSNKLSPLTFGQVFFRPQFTINEGIDNFLRGSLFTEAQEVDNFVTDLLRNFLFTDIPQEAGLDLVALNIQRGRDHTLASYNDLRAFFRGRRARRFSQITRNVALQSTLQSIYGSVDKVEAWVGLVCEDHVRGSSFGRTLLALWRREFERLRDGDVFFYLNEGAISDQLLNLRFVRRRLRGRNSMREVIVRNSRIPRYQIGGLVWTA